MHWFVTLDYENDIQLDKEIVFDISTGKVRNKTTELSLSPVNARVLASLVRNPGELISRQSLFDEVWPNQSISDDTLNRAIADLRGLFKQITQHNVIETLPRRGYRWVLTPTSTASQNSPEKVIEPPEIQQKLSFTDRSVVITSLLIVVSIVVLVSWVGLSRSPARIVILPIEATVELAEVETERITALIYQNVLRIDELRLLPKSITKSSNNEYLDILSNRFDIDLYLELEVIGDKNAKTLTMILINAQTLEVIDIAEIDFTSIEQLDLKISSEIESYGNVETQ